MNIFVINTLTLSQYNDAKELIDRCSKHDGTRGVSFLDSELNEDDTFPCFYMMYEGSELISFLSVFLAETYECEIYANTHPDYREKGYFSRLYKEAMKNIKKYGIEKIVCVSEPESAAGTTVLNKLGYFIEREEYLMSYDMSVIPKPQGKLKLTYSKENNTEVYEAYLKDEIVGSCNVEFTRSHAIIYEFQIFEEYRGNGYGTEMLLLILERLLSVDVSKILLHVSGANITARTMYLHHGFDTEEEIDYWS